eukprot:8623509-Pyramimonas_sp.AAC.1
MMCGACFCSREAPMSHMRSEHKYSYAASLPAPTDERMNFGVVLGESIATGRRVMRALLAGRCPADRTRAMRQIEPFTPTCQLCGYANNDEQQLHEHLRSQLLRSILQPASPTGPRARPTAEPARREGDLRHARRSFAGGGPRTDRDGGGAAGLPGDAQAGEQAPPRGGHGRGPQRPRITSPRARARPGPRPGLRAPRGDRGHDGQARIERGQGRPGSTSGACECWGLNADKPMAVFSTQAGKQGNEDAQKLKEQHASDSNAGLASLGPPHLEIIAAEIKNASDIVSPGDKQILVVFWKGAAFQGGPGLLGTRAKDFQAT